MTSNSRPATSRPATSQSAVPQPAVPRPSPTQEPVGPRLNRRGFLKWTAASGAAATLASTSLPALAASGPRTARQRAARCLAQCTFGGDLQLIDTIVSTGFENWLDAQMALPPSLVLPTVQALFEANPDDAGDEYAHHDWTWWENIFTKPDVVRHRIVFCLSQLFVISRYEDQLYDSSFAVGAYHDVLARHAFGNFRDLLLAVALQPSMGIYLSHLNNRRSDPSLNRFPDENFARELMQLFSIGLFELNPDGSRKLDSSGQPIPTYGNAEITEMAKIFTGLTLAPEDGEPVVFSDEYDTLHRPMVMFESEHEPGPKTLLGGFVVPGGQTGMQDIEAAIDHLVAHPNVGPFIGRRLIQCLVTSNPSPAYVARVAAAFADNGMGVRGDMKAVFKAILLDPEARDESKLDDPTFGKVREPFVRWVQLGRTFHASSDTGRFRHFGGLDAGGQSVENIEVVFLAQYPFFSPSVFNFFSPSHQPAGTLTDADLVAPEMEIIHAYTSIATMNAFDRAIVEELYLEDLWEVPVWLDLDPEITQAEISPTALVDRLDLLLTYGTLSAGTRQIVLDAILPLADPFDQARLALYLIVISPEFSVQR